MSNVLGDLPRLFPRPEQTIAGIGRMLRQGEVSCVDILNACLEQVDEWEPKVHAWVVLDREGAMEQAQALDQELRSGQDRGPLHGIPMGIKDIIDVRGLPTACGARRWADRIAERDAYVVDRLREAGAVMVGKTVTTPYAWIDPPLTRNPWDLDRTPGGSSSGSAAAVACGMCYGAIGTQTGGSITRPASFCGVAGMKPSSFFTQSRGVLPLARSLDHIGPIARSASDLRLLFEAMWSRDAGGDEPPPTAIPPRLVRPRGFFDRVAEPPMLSAFEECLDVLARRGAEIVAIDDPVDFEGLNKDHRLVMAAEAAHVHSSWLDEYPHDYPARITELVVEGRRVLALDYLRARAEQNPTRFEIARSVDRAKADAMVTPATIGTPPNPTTTGDPAFNSPWSFTGLPTISVPMGTDGDRMPLALQLIGDFRWDWELLHSAEWCEDAIRTSRQ